MHVLVLHASRWIGHGKLFNRSKQASTASCSSVGSTASCVEFCRRMQQLHFTTAAMCPSGSWLCLNSSRKTTAVQSIYNRAAALAVLVTRTAKMYTTVQKPVILQAERQQSRAGRMQSVQADAGLKKHLTGSQLRRSNQTLTQGLHDAWHQ